MGARSGRAAARNGRADRKFRCLSRVEWSADRQDENRREREEMEQKGFELLSACEIQRFSLPIGAVSAALAPPFGPHGPTDAGAAHPGSAGNRGPPVGALDVR